MKNTNATFSNFLLYKSGNGEIKVDVLLQSENIWMPQKKIAELFDVDRTVITKHIKNIFESGELEEKSNVQKMHFSYSDKPIKYYNLDVNIAKNYLSKKELKPLNRIVTMYLDYAEHQAEKMISMTMKDWVEKLNLFLKFNEEEILNNTGKITAEIAKEFAENEFEKYKIIQDKKYLSDFDKEIKKLFI